MSTEKKCQQFCSYGIAAGLLLFLTHSAVMWGQPSSRTQTLLRGTRLQLNILQSVSTRHSQEGDQFTATLETPVQVEGQTLLPKGTQFVGTVSRVKRPGRFRGKAELFLCFDYVRLADGREEPVVASITRLDTPEEKRLDREGAVQGPGSSGRDALVVLGGGAAGAGIGTIAGGGKGAAVGGAAGSLLGMVGVFLTRGQDIEIPSKTGLEIVLEKPLTLSSIPAAGDRPLHK